MELNDITAWRALYLQTIKRNDETEKLPVVYLDETYIHSGHTAGKCWQDDDEDGVLEPVSKGQRFIIVHAGEGILLRPQLLAIVNRYKPEPVYAVDAILKGLGHKEAFNFIPVEEWCNHCVHVKKLEEESRSKVGYLDAPFIVSCSESEESSDDDSQDESDEEFNSIEPLAIVHAEHNCSKKI
ncbi:unnamed protein product [Parnassius apollo]|uniref:(apollo) hypothetical protein n=1 Tax=Parnassius apollo TaxID=110799 RepID=A0A8S3WVL1_PARAO|nr:unnamed protein product [Parnassius apollo]